MRIALVSPYSLAAHGGVQGQVLGLAYALAQQDEIAVFAPGRSEFRNGVEIHGAGAVLGVPANGSRAPISLGPNAWPATKRSIEAFGPDVIHVHEPFVPMVGVAGAMCNCAPVVATFHRAGVGPLYRRMGPLLAPIARRCAERVAVSSEAANTAAVVLGPTLAPTRVLSNAVDVERFSCGVASMSEVPTVVFIGRLERRKGLAVLLRAFSSLAVDARLLVVGSGPEEQQLRSLAVGDPRVTFLGALSDTELAEVLRDAEIFVAPAIGGESFGVIVLEAMAAGTAVLASDLPGYREAAGDVARFFHVGDPSSLAQGLTDLLDDPVERADRVSRGRRRAASFSFGQLAGRYRAIYLEVVHQDRG